MHQAKLGLRLSLAGSGGRLAPSPKLADCWLVLILHVNGLTSRYGTVLPVDLLYM